jgi:hypothetical protein
MEASSVSSRSPRVFVYNRISSAVGKSLSSFCALVVVDDMECAIRFFTCKNDSDRVNGINKVCDLRLHRKYISTELGPGGDMLDENTELFC